MASCAPVKLLRSRSCAMCCADHGEARSHLGGADRSVPRDFESLTLMRMRQKAERERLIAEMEKEEAPA